MDINIIWGILPDTNEQPRIIFGEDFNKQPVLMVSGINQAANYMSAAINGIPGPQVSGIQSVAFGGRRFDYDGDEEDVTSEITANQCFSSGCGNKIVNNSHWSGAIGKDNIIGQYLDEGGILQNADLTYCVMAIGNSNKIANYTKTNSARYFSGMAVGVANELYGTKSFIQGSSNKSTGEISFISGYKNISEGSRTTMFGGYNTVTVKYTSNTQYNMVFGSYNIIEQTIKTKKVKNNILLGTGLKLTDVSNVIACGQYNTQKSNVLFLLGNGSSDTSRNNAFEVYLDGRSKTYGTPKENNDIIRWQEYQKLVAAIEALGGSV